MIKKEIWRDIPRYEGYYQVSNYGKVRSLDRYILCGENKERFVKGGIKTLFKDKDGYLHVDLYRKEKNQKRIRIGRLVLTVFDRQPKDNEQCNHKDGNKQNNYIENLEWCTAKQNCDHRDNVLGRSCKGMYIGEKSSNSKLIEKQIREIRKDNRAHKEIAKEYNISRRYVGHIKSGKRWKHIK